MTEHRPLSRFTARARRPWEDARGFTLIEVMIVVVILGLLAGLVVPRIMDQPDKARVVKAKMQMESYGTALKQYRMDNGFYPTTEQGLEALVSKPTSGRIPKNYPDKGYMDKLAEDPWGAAYIYVSPTERGDYAIISRGADGREGGEGVDADLDSRDSR